MYLISKLFCISEQTLSDMENYPETYKVPVGIFRLANELLSLKPYMYLPY